MAKQLNSKELEDLNAQGKLIGIFDVEEQAYHNGPATSKSQLDDINRSPRYYKVKKEKGSTPTAAMKFGTGSHHAALEPELFADLYVPMPQGRGYGKHDTKAAEEFRNAHPGKTCLTFDEHRVMGEMMEELWSHPEAPKLLKGKIEKAVYWIDKRTGEHLRCKIDVISDLGPLVDFKTTGKLASEGGFLSAGKMYRYPCQSVMYLDGINAVMPEANIQSFVFVVIEKSWPYGIGIYEYDGETLAMAAQKIAANIDTLIQCKKTGEWPGYTTGVKTISQRWWD